MKERVVIDVRILREVQATGARCGDRRGVRATDAGCERLVPTQGLNSRERLVPTQALDSHERLVPTQALNSHERLGPTEALRLPEMLVGRQRQKRREVRGAGEALGLSGPKGNRGRRTMKQGRLRRHPAVWRRM